MSFAVFFPYSDLMFCHHQLLAPAGQTISVGLSLRPHDPIAKRLVSREVTVQNVLLRVSVPKRTGRKRKRGSDEPFAFQQDSTIPLNGDTQVNNDPQPLNASALVGRLRDNPTNYTIEPVGSIKESHRFRGIFIVGLLLWRLLNPWQLSPTSRSRPVTRQS